MLTLLNEATSVTRRYSLELTEDDLVVIARALGHCRRPEDLPDHQNAQGHVALLHDAFSAAVEAHGLTLVWDSRDQTSAAA